MTLDYAKAREAMVEQQVRPWEVLDTRVLDVIVRLPRESFVPAAHRALAYADLAIPLAHGESMMKPVLEGRALQALALDGSEDVLEIGTGSGYMAACLGRLARSVLSIERHGDIAAAALATLHAEGLANVDVEHADAFAWNTDRKFDAICVTGAVDTVPLHFLGWLRPGGRMFIVRGRAPVMEAVLMHADVNGTRTESLFETDLAYLAGAAPVPAFAF
ncbi:MULTISPECIES: protein-L-isoaspartate O-methyltransferase [unclassified Luteimonas]|uniref:protein-L-isoaspartate O-methyltransferase family protein n=1 Tax=unclassified Luteimonas TaxID=2629088 RepID=UPI0018F092BA|nr:MULTISPECIES: protein-L-isoaspartate O-methyltransferase [unclassified Luteimonas]MBJ6981514.1 protein-L-isoaspartate O-methyltransferase [Luteimonas sp. MC1572]MBJ7575919.1 protein-L-isoaspartate O-methyltransferase [Luteimonas sp. MC1828]QQO02815.1 protein-L-isoaspartate O-methyltransferase [Luteimonas sp. MC1572]